jgi:hypothetical protein
VAARLLVLTDLERVSRGLPGFTGLCIQFDHLADKGATANSDPNGCTRATPNGCWDHRLNILSNYGLHPSMGAAWTKVGGVTSLTELLASAPPK